VPSNDTVGTLDRYHAEECERCRYTVQAAVDGPGTVSFDPPWSGFLEGEVVQLTALPGWGARWQGWTGDVISSDNPLTVTITQDTWLTATFVARYLYVPLSRAQ
jgi:hypothetical protein